MNLLGYTGRVKATSRPCGVSENATYLFDSEESSSLVSGVLVVACPLEALEVGLGHSFTMRPAALQNMQSILLKWHLYSMAVSLLLLPDFNKRSGLGVAEVEEVVEAFPLTSEEALEPLECGDVGGCMFAAPVCERMV